MWEALGFGCCYCEKSSKEPVALVGSHHHGALAPGDDSDFESESESEMPMMIGNIYAEEKVFFELPADLESTVPSEGDGSRCPSKVAGAKNNSLTSVTSASTEDSLRPLDPSRIRSSTTRRFFSDIPRGREAEAWHENSFSRIVTDGIASVKPKSPYHLPDPQALQLELVEATLSKSVKLLELLESQPKLEMQACLDLGVELQDAAASAMELACTRQVHGAMDAYEVANAMLDRVALLLQECNCSGA
mmetsp:Transcript_115109/g.245976  ORF Transcript_115109/g.245976 Transcript_115109/m.245976 type:complete len:247 (+) Transcript_115109:60-800(+)